MEDKRNNYGVYTLIHRVLDGTSLAEEGVTVSGNVLLPFAYMYRRVL
jgi:hypothetical protein